MIVATLPPPAIDGHAAPPKDGKGDGGTDGARSGEGADTALEVMIRKRKLAEQPVDVDFKDCLPPQVPLPPAP